MPEATSLQKMRRVWEVFDGTISPGLMGNEKKKILVRSFEVIPETFYFGLDLDFLFLSS